MEQLRVNLGKNSYDISFNTSFDALADRLRAINAPEKILIVCDTNVLALYSDEVAGVLKNAGYDAACYAFAAGEENKEIATVLGICAAAMEAGLDRSSMIIALGGGVVGDMAGLAAALYMRGIRYVQVPTTLLSQSDSSVGGKTGVDFRGAKNILGAFLQPSHVYINVSALKTLPRREIVSGMGEVIKHALIADAGFFDYITNNPGEILSLDPELMMAVCRKNCAVKAHVVEMDERESGERMKLNFGHTVGHAIEGAVDFSLSHGECVGIGMRAAAYISNKLGTLTDGDTQRIYAALSQFGFAERADFDFARASGLLKSDKKNKAGKNRFVLLSGIGKAYITDEVPQGLCEEALRFVSK